MVAVAPSVTVGEIFELVRSGKSYTRTDIAHETGLSRSTLTERLELLFDAGIIREGAELASSGGRRAKSIQIVPDSWVTVAVDVGEDHTRLSIIDLAGRVLTESVGALAIDEGPEAVINWIADEGARLLTDREYPLTRLLGVGLSLPAPVDFKAGTVVGPSVMVGWDGTAIRELIQKVFDVPVVIENDVNARGLGELNEVAQSTGCVLYVKADTGIGSAIINSGELFRGSQGSAGDIGHIRLEPVDGPLCRCGSVGCVEAMAAGWALARDLRHAGFNVSSSADVMDLVRRNEPEARFALRQAGRVLGRAIAYSVSLLNPDRIIVGGILSSTSDELMTGIRESVYQLSLPLATRDLAFSTASNEATSGAVGVARSVVNIALSPELVNRRVLSRLDPRGA